MRQVKRKLLGVNIDHVATLRQARKGIEPDPVYAAVLAELAGAEQITIHLREDRRHIQDRDLKLLKQFVRRLNLEMALNDEIIQIALEVKPDEVTIVPERRQEITTEGGLDVSKNKQKLLQVIPEFHKHGIEVSLFIDPEIKMIELSKEVGATFIELHTGEYSNAKTEKERLEQLKRLEDSAIYASNIGLRVNAGHGLNYFNTYDVARIPEIEVLNIGHSIISRAVFVGIKEAVKEMKEIIEKAYMDTLIRYSTNK